MIAVTNEMNKETIETRLTTDLMSFLAIEVIGEHYEITQTTRVMKIAAMIVMSETYAMTGLASQTKTTMIALLRLLKEEMSVWDTRTPYELIYLSTKK